MELQLLDWTIIIAFLAISLAIGIYFKNRASSSLTDFFLGGRSLPWYIAGISMVATTFAADTPLAVTEMVADSGISKNWLWWSFLIGGLLTTFFFARLWRRANVLTEPELIEFRYSGKTAGFLRGFKAVYLGILMNCIVIGWVNVALASLLTEFFGISSPEVYWWVGGFMLIAVAYSSLSGLLGVAITDTVQFFIAMIGVIVLAYLVLNSSDVGGVDNLKSNLDEDIFNFFPSLGSDSPTPSGAENSGGGIGTFALSVGAFLSFVAIQWWASWYPGAEPGGGGYVAQRMMSAKNEKHSLLATLFFNIGHYALRPWPWIIVALCAVYLYSPDHAFEDKQLAQQISFFQDGEPSKDLDKQDAWLSEAYQYVPNLEAQVASNASVKDTLLAGLKTEEQLYRYHSGVKQAVAADSTLARSVTFSYKPRLGYIYAMKDYLPTGWLGLLLVAFLAAYLSTISTQVNWGASYLVNDLYKRFARPENSYSSEKAAQKDYVKMSRVASLVIMVLGLAVTPLITNIAAAWEFLMGCGAGLGLVLILRWYWWRINVWSEIVATIAPFIGFTIGKYLLVPWLGDGFADNKGDFIFTVLFTTIAWIIATYVTSPTDMQTLIRFRERVRPDGWWGPVPPPEGHKKQAGKGLNLAICWISSVIMVYSLLFTIGKLVLKEWNDALIWGVIALVSGTILAFFLRRTNLADDGL